jgi:excisionase family DNA binding protein
MHLIDEKPGDVLTTEELSSCLKIPKFTPYKLVREGKISSQKIGRRWRFQKAAIDQATELYHRLVILAASGASSKTVALRAVHKGIGAPLKDLIDSPSLFPFRIRPIHAENLVAASSRLDLLRHGLDDDLVMLRKPTTKGGAP